MAGNRLPKRGSGMQTEFQTRLLTQSDCYQAGRTIVPRGSWSTPPGWLSQIRRYSSAAGTGRGGRLCPRLCGGGPGDPDPALELAGLARGRGSGAAPTTPTSPLSAVNRRDTPTREERWWAMTRRSSGPILSGSIKNAAALCARLCRMYGLDPREPGVVICHAEGTGWGSPAGTEMCSSGGRSMG